MAAAVVILCEVVQSAAWRIVLVAGLLIGLVIIAAAVVLLARKHLLGGSDRHTPETGFTLGEIRAMRKRGELSEAEYNRARDVLIRETRREETASASPEREQADTNREFE